MQLADWVDEKVPAKQLEQVEDAAGEYLPAAQIPAVPKPTVGQYLPAKHGVQELEPVSSWNRPTLQLKQLKEAMIDAYIPAEHDKHEVEAEDTEYFPTSQAIQSADK